MSLRGEMQREFLQRFEDSSLFPLNGMQLRFKEVGREEESLMQ